MTEQYIEETVESLHAIRREKSELERKERNLRQAIMNYLSENGLTQLNLKNGFQVSIKKFVRSRDFDVNLAQAALKLDIFMSLLSLDQGKFNEMVNKGVIPEQVYRQFVIEEYWTEQLKISQSD